MKGVNVLLILVAGIFMCGLGSALVDTDSDGYYDIHNCTELQNMSLNLSANYELMNDIDCTETSGWNGEAGFNPIGNDSVLFTGNFNGNNYTISNLTINLPSNAYVGLFGYLSGNISNIGLIGVNVSGYSHVGGLAGYSRGSISNSHSIGNVASYAYFVGGLVGYQGSGTISNSYSTANVTGSDNVGGLIGDCNGLISNSYSTGSVAASEYLAGGLVGASSTNCSISNSYSTGTISGYFIGGLVSSSSGWSISSSYWDIETSGYGYENQNEYGSVGKSTTEMKNISTFIGWDFINIWEIKQDYPFFRTDFVAPNITLNNVLNSTDTSRNFTFLVSDESSIQNCTLNVYDLNGTAYSLGDLNQSIINKSANNTIIHDYPSFAVGNYTAHINCTDTYGFEGKSNTISFEVQKSVNCSDGIQNQDETGVDCGGVCSACSSGSSGSSGGGVPSTRAISDYALSQGFTSILGKSNLWTFNLNNQSHSLTVNNISNGSVIITVQSTPQIFNILFNKSVDIDINSDGVYDLEVSYLRYLNGYAFLKAKAISVSYQLPAVKNETENESPYGIGDETEEVLDNSDSKLFIGLSVVLFLIFLGIVFKIFLINLKKK